MNILTSIERINEMEEENQPQGGWQKFVLDQVGD